MLRPSPNHGTQRLPNDDDDDDVLCAWRECITLIDQRIIKLPTTIRCAVIFNWLFAANRTNG